MKMFHLSVLNRLRRLKTNQQQIVRSIRVAVRTHSGETITKCSRTPEASRGNHCLQQLTGRSFSSFQLLKAQHCFAVRCYTSSSVRPEDGELIYTGTLGRVIRGVKFFSYSSSMFSLCVMPLVLMKTGIGVNSLALQVAFCGIVGFFTFLTPVLLHLVTKGYILRLYHDKETDMYTAITYSALLMEKRTVFHQSDVTIPDISKMFTSFYAKKRSMLVNPMLFPLPHDYNHLMGYDRPFSFDLDDLNKPDKS